MKFGKLPDISLVDFSLPPDHPSTAGVLAALPKTGKAVPLHVGCTGWSMKEWLGKVYPKNAKAKDYLQHYSRQFSTIELNTTHYRIPTPATIEKWYQESAADFKFCPKIPQTISHSRDLGTGGGQIALFCDSIAGLQEKLGCCFIQLPPYFDRQRLPLLDAFLDQFPATIPLAVEVRHESWFESPGAAQPLLECLHRHQTATVITDVAGRRDVLHMGLSNGTAMLRFVGNDLHPTDYERIQSWTRRLREWTAAGLQEIYFFTHEPDNLLAPDLSLYLSEQVAADPMFTTRGPKFIDGPESGEQMALF